MKKTLVVLAIVFSIAAMTAQPGYSAVQGVDPATTYISGVQHANGNGIIPFASSEDSSQRAASFLLAKEVDLREVDWGPSKQATQVDEAQGTTVTVQNANGEEEEEEGDEEEGEEDEEDEEDSGWDRVWDAPKLG